MLLLVPSVMARGEAAKTGTSGIREEEEGIQLQGRPGLQSQNCSPMGQSCLDLSLGKYRTQGCNGHDSADMNLGKLWEMVRDREAQRAAVHGMAKSQTRLSDRTTTRTQGIHLEFSPCAAHPFLIGHISHNILKYKLQCF